MSAKNAAMSPTYLMVWQNTDMALNLKDTFQSEFTIIELVNALKNIIKNKTKVNEINEELINNYLYTNNIPDPDILIRTGGEKRLSNFLLWQLSYAELFFINKNWPDFNFFDLKKVINTFKVTKRKFGGLNE